MRPRLGVHFNPNHDNRGEFSSGSGGYDPRPTHSSEWVHEGDRVVMSQSGLGGVAVRVVAVRSTPHVVVRWDNGHTGRVLITQLRRERS